jgi:hypothetical protein
MIRRRLSHEKCRLKVLSIQADSSLKEGHRRNPKFRSAAFSIPSYCAGQVTFSVTSGSGVLQKHQ